MCDNGEVLQAGDTMSFWVKHDGSCAKFSKVKSTVPVIETYLALKSHISEEDSPNSVSTDDEVMQSSRPLSYSDKTIHEKLQALDVLSDRIRQTRDRVKEDADSLSLDKDKLAVVSSYIADEDRLLEAFKAKTSTQQQKISADEIQIKRDELELQRLEALRHELSVQIDKGIPDGPLTQTGNEDVLISSAELSELPAEDLSVVDATISSPLEITPAAAAPAPAAAPIDGPPTDDTYVTSAAPAAP